MPGAGPSAASRPCNLRHQFLHLDTNLAALAASAYRIRCWSLVAMAMTFGFISGCVTPTTSGMW